MVTQLFDNAFIRLRGTGPENRYQCPIVPGIMPITNYEQVQRSYACAARLCPCACSPNCAVKDDAQAVMQLGVARHAAVLGAAVGSSGIHFYTLNRSVPNDRQPPGRVAELEYACMVVYAPAASPIVSGERVGGLNASAEFWPRCCARQVSNVTLPPDGFVQNTFFLQLSVSV